MQNAGAGIRALQVIPNQATVFALIRDHALADFVPEPIAGKRTGLKQYVMLLGLT